MKQRFDSFMWAAFVTSILVLIVFAMLRWLNIPVGNFLDWIIGLLSGWWLLMVTTIPWNIHFQAREVLDTFKKAQAEHLPVEAEKIAYARGWRNRSLIIAVGLHLISAAGLYWLAASGITPIGYIAAIVALLLTFLRPTARGYLYLKARLNALSQEVRYPMESVNTLRATVDRLALITENLDTEKPTSWASQQEAKISELNDLVTRTRSELNDLRSFSLTQHNQLVRDTERAVAQISADGQFLNNVREIIRFVKEA